MSRPPKGPPEEYRLAFIKWLVDNGAEKEIIDKGGFTPLYHAASNADMAVVKLLLHAGSLVRPNMTCVDPISADAVQASRPLLKLLTKHKQLEAYRREEQERERRISQERAAEHRRQLALKLAQKRNNSIAGGQGAFQLQHLSTEDAAAHARVAYEKVQLRYGIALNIDLMALILLL